MHRPRLASRHVPSQHPGRSLALAALAALGVALALAGCDEKKKERPQSQVAARVDGHAITLSQINLVLEQQTSLRPEQSDAASRQVLARLVDQRLLFDQAERLELEREPRVAERLDAARREILARAYAEQVGEKAAPATPQEVAEYYQRHPELFAQRRIYTLQELAIEARPEQLPALREQLRTAPSIQAFITQLQAEGYRFAGNQAVRAAEQLAAQALHALASMQPGQATVGSMPGGVLVTVLAGARNEALSLPQAQGAIEQHLLAERRRALVAAELGQLRKAARIEYGERFAPVAPAPAPAAAGSAAAAASAARAVP